jgi:hypothetical protein
VDSTLAAIRRRKEVVAFAIGVTLFAAGAAALTRSHQRTAARALEGIQPAAANPARRVGGTVRPSIGPPIGPTLGTSVGAYVEKRRAVLRKLAAAQPGAASWAVVSFDRYREPEDVTDLLSTPFGRTLRVAAFQQRVPAGGFAPETVELGRQPVAAVLAAKAGAAVAARLERERSGIQRLIPTVGDAAYRQVYEAELRRLTGAAEALRTRPATVFALVVHGSNDALARLAKLPGVRLVDIADAPGAAGVAGPAFALLPDDTRTTTFGRPAP